ncbi:MAG: phosphoglucomutase/phosphomannomutase family protein [bacterium]
MSAPEERQVSRRNSENEALVTELRFGTDGIRGPVGPVINQEAIARIVAGVAQYMQTPGYRAESHCPSGAPLLLVGGDCRSTSDYFIHMTCTIASQLGIRVAQCEGYVATPMLAHGILELGAQGGIMVTASHNPADHNGIKFLPWYGGPALPTHTLAIEDFLNGPPPDLARYAVQDIEPHNPAAAYAEQLGKLIDFDAIRQAKLKIAYDALYGVGKGYMRQLLRNWDIQAQVFHGDDDPTMGKAMPDPSEERLSELASQVSSRGFDIGIATDGDADRFAAVDAAGHYCPPNYCLSLIAHYLYSVQHAKGGIVRSISTTHRLDRIAAAHNEPVIATPVGFKYLSAKLRSGPQWLMAGEESGGLALRGHVPEKDGLLGCLLLLEALAVTGKSLAALWAEVEAAYGPVVAERLDWRIPIEQQQAMLDRLAAEDKLTLAGETFTRVAPERAEFATESGSWVLVRRSGTEDCLRVYLETDELGRLERMKSGVEGLLRTAL